MGWKNNEATCLTATAREGTRRDYALVNDRFLPLITSFEVEHGDKFATHSPILLKLKNVKLIRRSLFHNNILILSLKYIRNPKS